MKKCQLKKKRQSGSSIVESMIALILMCLIFFGAMQVFQWAMARMFCGYASFYAAKAFSLGYSHRIMNKAARIAAIPISGPDENDILKLTKEELTNKLRLYMSTGNAGVEFPYWDSSGRDPDLRVSIQENEKLNYINAVVKLENAPYLSKELKNFLNISGRPVNPQGSSTLIDHSSGWVK